MKIALLLTLLLFASTILCAQNPLTEAVYYDADDNLYKIEQKFKTDTGFLYLIHTNSNSKIVTTTSKIKKDTLIITESFNLVISDNPSTIEKFLISNKWITSVSDIDSSILISGYKFIYPYANEWMVDTVFLISH